MSGRGPRGGPCRVRPDAAGVVRLAEGKQGDRFRILAIDAGRGAAVNLMNMGLGIGREIELVGRSPLGGPVLVRHGDTRIAIGHRMAQKILVEKTHSRPPA